MNQLVIIGASGHGKVVADIAAKNGYTNIVFLDDNEALTECGGYPVVGKSYIAEIMKDVDLFVAVGNAEIRKRIMQSAGISGKCVTLIHPNAVVAEDCRIGNGTVIMAGAVVNSGTIIGRGCIVNTCASVDHDCVLGDYVHVSVGAHLCGTVHVCEKTWIGAGATVINNISITASCMIGAGGIVVQDIDMPGTYIGVPVKPKFLR